MTDRPAIPAQVRRDVLIESGYRCAMPHCRETEIDINHIRPYAEVHEHTFDNLIALCPNCHRRYTNGEIDHKAMLQIKANLSILSHRYSELERRYLARQANDGAGVGAVTMLSGGLELLMANLVADELVMQAPVNAIQIEFGLPNVPDFPMVAAFVLTDKGKAFIDHWVAGQPID
ncbi:MAG: HNH endonuclease [Acidimicrobiales bacterium]